MHYTAPVDVVIALFLKEALNKSILDFPACSRQGFKINDLHH